MVVGTVKQNSWFVTRLSLLVLVMLMVMTSIMTVTTQAKPLCYRSSFNGSAGLNSSVGVRFIDQACLDRQAKRQYRQRFAAVLAKKRKGRRSKRKRLKKAASKKKLKRQQRKRGVIAQSRQRKNVLLLQKLLAEHQHDIGKPNGILGPKTKKAMADYAARYNIKRVASVHAVLKHLLAQKSPSILLPTRAPVLTPNTQTTLKAETLSSPAIATSRSKTADIAKATKLAALARQPFTPSVERGRKHARQCLGCHSFTASEGHKAGPNLHGVMGQFIGSANQFNYSETLKFQMTMGNIWSKQELDCFLKDPQGCKPGTSMSFNGIKSANKRADLIAYIAQLGQ